MARVSDARKVEVLRSVTFDEYGQRLTFMRDRHDASVQVRVSISDPRRHERDQVRRWLSEHLDGDNINFEALTQWLDERDEATTVHYGERKGEPEMFETSFSFDREQAEVVEHIFSTADLDYRASVTIRASLASEAVTKGF